MKVTSAPKLDKAVAMAVPCAPEDRFAMYLIGSIGSCVGPDVTITWVFFNGPLFKIFSASRAICSGSDIRPGPKSPQAISPSFGPTKYAPSNINVE